MTLTVGDTTIESPSAAQIREAINGLGRRSEPFVILERDTGEFLQAHGTPAEGFLVEHHRASGEVEEANLDLAKTTQAFTEYLEGTSGLPRGGRNTRRRRPARKPGRWAVWTLAGVTVIVGIIWAVAGRSQLLFQAIFAGGGLFLAAQVADALRRGEVETRTTIRRDEDPIFFWINVAIYAVLAVGGIAVAIVLPLGLLG